MGRKSRMLEDEDTGTYALIIAIVGCRIKSRDLRDGERTGMRRYPVSAEDAFHCFRGEDFNSEAKDPQDYNYNERIRYQCS